MEVFLVVYYSPTIFDNYYIAGISLSKTFPVEDKWIWLNGLENIWFESHIIKSITIGFIEFMQC